MKTLTRVMFGTGAIAALLQGGLLGCAQPPEVSEQETTTVEGQIKLWWTNEPIEGVEVRTRLGSMVTGTDGTYELEAPADAPVLIGVGGLPGEPRNVVAAACEGGTFDFAARPQRGHLDEETTGFVTVSLEIVNMPAVESWQVGVDIVRDGFFVGTSALHYYISSFNGDTLPTTLPFPEGVAEWGVTAWADTGEELVVLGRSGGAGYPGELVLDAAEVVRRRVFVDLSLEETGGAHFFGQFFDPWPQAIPHLLEDLNGAYAYEGRREVDIFEVQGAGPAILRVGVRAADGSGYASYDVPVEGDTVSVTSEDLAFAGISSAKPLDDSDFWPPTIMTPQLLDSPQERVQLIATSREGGIYEEDYELHLAEGCHPSSVALPDWYGATPTTERRVGLQQRVMAGLRLRALSDALVQR